MVTRKRLSITLHVRFLSHYTNISHVPFSDTLQSRVSLACLCTAKITYCLLIKECGIMMEIY